MDERQTQIKEGAGLEESRVNVEFVDFLKKWSTPALLVVAAVVVVMFALRKFEERRQAYIDTAFSEYEAAARPPAVDPGSSPVTSVVAVSPMTLGAVAEEYSDVKGARWLSRLAAADTYMTAVRTGVTLGATVLADGTVGDPEQDLLGPEQRSDYLEQARSLYRAVLQDTEGDPNATLHTLRSLFGIAAVQESAGELEGARQTLDRAATLASDRGFATLARLAEHRIQTLDGLDQPITLVSQDSLPELPWLAPPPPEAEPSTLPDTQGDEQGPFGPILPPDDPPPAAPEGGAPGDAGDPGPASGDAGGGG